VKQDVITFTLVVKRDGSPHSKPLIKFNILKFWHRVVSIHADRLTLQICYNTWSKSLSNSGVINWAKRTSNILNSLYECNLLHQGHVLGDATMTQELHTWRSAVLGIPRHSETGGHLLFYCQLKSTPAPEPYTNSISTNKRHSITMLGPLEEKFSC